MASGDINFHGSDIVGFVFNEMLQDKKVSQKTRDSLKEYLEHNGSIFTKDMRSKLSGIALGNGKVSDTDVDDFYAFIMDYQGQADDALQGYDNIAKQLISRTMLDMRDGQVTAGTREAIDTFLKKRGGVLGPGLRKELKAIASGDGEVAANAANKLSNMMGRYQASIDNAMGGYDTVGRMVMEQIVTDMRDGKLSAATQKQIKGFLEKNDGTLGPGMTARLRKLANGNGEVTKEDREAFSAAVTGYEASIEKDLRGYNLVGGNIIGRVMADMRDGDVSESTRKALSGWLERNDGTLGPGMTKRLKEIASGTGAVEDGDLKELRRALGGYSQSIENARGGYNNVGKQLIGRILADARDGQVSQTTRERLLGYLRENNGVFDVPLHNQLAAIALGDGNITDEDRKLLKKTLAGQKASVQQDTGGYNIIGQKLINRIVADMRDGQVTAGTRENAKNFLEKNAGILGPNLEKRIAKIANGDGDITEEDYIAFTQKLTQYSGRLQEATGNYDGVANGLMRRIVADMRDGQIQQSTRDNLQAMLDERGGNLPPVIRDIMQEVASGDGVVTDAQRKEFQKNMGLYTASINREIGGYDGYAGRIIRRTVADLRDGEVTEETQEVISNLLAREDVGEKLNGQIASGLQSIAEDKDGKIGATKKARLIGAIDDYNEKNPPMGNVAGAQTGSNGGIFPSGTSATGAAQTASGASVQTFDYETDTGSMSGVVIGAAAPHDPTSITHNTAADDALNSN